MKEYFIVCFRNFLSGNGSVFIDLFVIELDGRFHFTFQYHLVNYFHEKVKKNELDLKEEYQMGGSLDVIRVFQVPKDYKEVIKIDSFDIDEIYEAIKTPLKKAIEKKIKINRKES